ncbi:MAG: sigma-70 family RNA polymerase sigma factor [Thermoanaerobaculia bacterium]
MDAEEKAPKTGPEVAEQIATDVALQRKLVEYASARFHIARETAEDLLQDVMIGLMTREELIRRPEGFTFRVFHLRCVRHIERLVDRRELLSNRPPTPTRPIRDEQTSAEMAVALQQGFQMISAGCQELLRAFYLEGKSLKETADGLALSRRGIWTLINRCLWRLRRCFDR